MLLLFLPPEGLKHPFTWQLPSPVTGTQMSFDPHSSCGGLTNSSCAGWPEKHDLESLHSVEDL